MRVAWGWVPLGNVPRRSGFEGSAGARRSGFEGSTPPDPATRSAVRILEATPFYRVIGSGMRVRSGRRAASRVSCGRYLGRLVLLRSPFGATKWPRPVASRRICQHDKNVGLNHWCYGCLQRRWDEKRSQRPFVHLVFAGGFVIFDELATAIGDGFEKGYRELGRARGGARSCFGAIDRAPERCARDGRGAPEAGRRARRCARG